MGMHLAAEPCRSVASDGGFVFVEDSIDRIGIFNVSVVLTISLFRGARFRLSFPAPAKLLECRLAGEAMQKFFAPSGLNRARK